MCFQQVQAVTDRRIRCKLRTNVQVSRGVGFPARFLAIPAFGVGFRAARYGPVCVGWTFVSFWVNSKRRRHSLATLFPFASGGVKAHFLAACKARSAKNLLGPGESNSAADTPPDGSTCTFTLTRTFPWIVPRAFGETSGKT